MAAVCWPVLTVPPVSVAIRALASTLAAATICTALRTEGTSMGMPRLLISSWISQTRRCSGGSG